MGRGASLIRNCGMAALVALAASACFKTDAEEMRAEIVSGSAFEVTIMAGVSAAVTPLARAHCELYRKQAVVRDVKVVGTQLEAWTTGSRAYLHYYDCL